MITSNIVKPDSTLQSKVRNAGSSRTPISSPVIVGSAGHATAADDAVDRAPAAVPSIASPPRPLRIWPISDLHVGTSEGWPGGQIPQADLAIVAGDVREGLVSAVEWLALHIRPHMPVIFTPGNHEFYGTMHDHAL